MSRFCSQNCNLGTKWPLKPEVTFWSYFTVLCNKIFGEIREKYQAGQDITDDQLHRLSPLGWGHINLTGDYVWNARQPTDLENLRSMENPSQST